MCLAISKLYLEINNKQFFLLYLLTKLIRLVYIMFRLNCFKTWIISFLVLSN